MAVLPPAVASQIQEGSAQLSLMQVRCRCGSLEVWARDMLIACAGMWVLPKAPPNAILVPGDAKLLVSRAPALALHFVVLA